MPKSDLLWGQNYQITVFDADYNDTGDADVADDADADVQQVARSLAESGYPLAAYLPHLSPHHFLPKVN